MNNNSHRETLLDDVLAEALPPGLQARMLDETLAAVRRRVILRRLRRTAGACVALAALVYWKSSGLRPELPGPPALTVIASRPLPPSQLIETDAGSVTLVATGPGNLGWITDAANGTALKELDDRELLDLLAGKTVALVRLPSGPTELVFANPADAGGFPMQ